MPDLAKPSTIRSEQRYHHSLDIERKEARAEQRKEKIAGINFYCKGRDVVCLDLASALVLPRSRFAPFNSAGGSLLDKDGISSDVDNHTSFSVGRTIAVRFVRVHLCPSSEYISDLLHCLV